MCCGCMLVCAADSVTVCVYPAQVWYQPPLSIVLFLDRVVDISLHEIDHGSSELFAVSLVEISQFMTGGHKMFQPASIMSLLMLLDNCIQQQQSLQHMLFS